MPRLDATRALGLALAVCLLMTAAAGCKQQAAQLTDLPPEIAVLLPPSPTLVVAMPSLEAYEAALDAVAADSSQGVLLTAEGRAAMDIRARLDDVLPGLGAQLDPQRPLAMAVVAPPPMTNTMVATLVVPLTDPAAPLGQPQGGLRSTLVHGDYLALSTLPDIAVQDSVPALTRGLKPGTVTVAMDVAGLLNQYRGLVDMTLGMMAMAPPPDPDQPGARQGLGPEEAKALGALLHKVMDSLQRFDFAATVDRQQVATAWHLAIEPGSPLDVGPQPPFADAAALTSLLPAGGDLLIASSTSGERIMDVFGDYYLATARRAAAAMPAEQGEAYLTWYRSYLDLIGALSCPQAAHVAFTDQGIRTLAVLHPADPAALVDGLARQLDLFSAVGLGVTFQPLEPTRAGGATVRRWRMELADASLFDSVPEGAGAGADQARQMAMMFEQLAPELSLAVGGDLAVLGMTDDADAFATLVAEAAKGPGRPVPAIAEAAAEAGDDCAQVLLGDLMPAMAWFLDFTAQATGEEPQALPDTPLPFRATSTMASDGWGGTLDSELPAIRAAVTAIQTMADEAKAKAGHQKP